MLVRSWASELREQVEVVLQDRRPVPNCHKASVVAGFIIAFSRGIADLPQNESRVWTATHPARWSAAPRRRNDDSTVRHFQTFDQVRIRAQEV